MAITSDMIRQALENGKQTYYEYDGSNREITIIEAPIHAKDGEPCLRTQIKYVGATTQILGSKEDVSIWVEATYKFENL